MALRTRLELLRDLAQNHVTQNTLETGSKFSIFSKKKEKVKPRFIPDALGVQGALSWRIVAEDCSTKLKGVSSEFDAYVAISPDTIILIQDNAHREVVFICATKSVIGWTAMQNSLRLYYHQVKICSFSL